MANFGLVLKLIDIEGVDCIKKVYSTEVPIETGIQKETLTALVDWLIIQEGDKKSNTFEVLGLNTPQLVVLEIPALAITRLTIGGPKAFPVASSGETVGIEGMITLPPALETLINTEILV